MKTRAEVVRFLAAKTGKPQNLIRAAVNEVLNMEVDGDSRDLCWQLADKPMGDGRKSITTEPIEVDEVQALLIWETIGSMLTYGHRCICLDGDPTFDMNGEFLDNSQKI